MSYNLKGFNVERDGVVIAVINQETAKLDFEEGCSTYRNYAVKKLRELGVWDNEKDVVIMDKLEPEEGQETPGTGELNYEFTYVSDGLRVDLDGDRIAVISNKTGGFIFNKDCEDHLESIVDALDTGGKLWNNETNSINLEELRRLCPSEQICPTVFELDKLKIKQGDTVVGAIELETGRLVLGLDYQDCYDDVVSMLNKLELWNDETERVNIEDLRERYPNEVFAKSETKTKPVKAVAEINTVKALVAAMQPHISEECPPMSKRLGDKTPEVLKWIEKNDKVRKEVLKK